MQRRNILKLTAGIVGFGIVGVNPVAAGSHPSNPPGQTNDRGNWIRGKSELVNVLTVEEITSDPTASNFEEEFTYWKVSYEPQSWDTWVYREPARLGGGNFVWEVGACYTFSGSFWYGVSAPDNDGIQHEIVHDGQATQYFDTADCGGGGWTEITAQFADGQLLHVNGVEPE